MHEATGGDPSRSHRWREYVHKYGAEQEVLVALRTRSGETWGMLCLNREPGEAEFADEELAFLRAISPSLAEGARRGLLVGEVSDPDGPDAPGLVVLKHDWSVDSLTPGAERWLTELPDGDWEDGRLPSSVLAVAGRALRTAENRDAPGEVALARVLSRSRWMVLHGASLVADGTRRVAVSVEPADPARISPLLMAAYGLTEREQDVTRLVLRGESTAQIAKDLYVSPQHRAATPEERLREDCRPQPARAYWEGLLLPLRAPPPRQRAAGDGRRTAPQRPLPDAPGRLDARFCFRGIACPRPSGHARSGRNAAVRAAAELAPRLLSADGHVCPHTTYVRELASQTA